MKHSLLNGLGLIFVLGSIAQIVSWRFRLPSILLLLLFGILAGPIGFDALHPDSLFGDILFPVVSLSVAVILFEGGLSLRLSELPGVRGVIFSLITFGMLTTWAIASGGAHYILGLDLSISVLLGAILTVSGPTVVIPMLRHVRPKPPLAEILKWEGILIDPVGAIAAVLVFEAILVGKFHEATSFLVNGVLHTLVVGLAIGVLTGVIIAITYRKHLIPEHLLNPFSLMMVIASYVLSDVFHPESGLLTVTVAGIVVANSRDVNVKKIIEFKENLVVLLISSLFIVLAARVSPSQFAKIDPLSSGLFLALLLFIARPAAVGISTLGSALSWRQRAFLAWLSPRGIVAAAVASVFSLQLEKEGVANADMLIPYTFLIITGTVVVYGLTSGPVAKLLGLSLGSPQGIIFMGAGTVTRDIAKLLSTEGFSVMLVDTNLINIQKARMEGLKAIQGNILSDTLFQGLELNEMGRFIAMTANHEANSLAAVKFAEEFGEQKVFQLPAVKQALSKSNPSQSNHLQGRILFDAEANYFTLTELLENGHTVKATTLSDEFTFEDFNSMYPENIPMFTNRADGNLRIITKDEGLDPQAGDRVIALVKEENE